MVEKHKKRDNLRQPEANWKMILKWIPKK